MHWETAQASQPNTDIASDREYDSSLEGSSVADADSLTLSLEYVKPGTYEVRLDGSVRSISRETFELTSFQSLMSGIVSTKQIKPAAKVKPGRLISIILPIKPVDISREVATGIRLKPKRILL